MPLRNRTPSRSKSPHGSAYTGQAANMNSLPSVSKSINTQLSQPTRQHGQGSTAQHHPVQQVYKSPHSYNTRHSNHSQNMGSENYRDSSQIQMSNMKHSDPRRYEPSPQGTGSMYKRNGGSQPGFGTANERGGHSSNKYSQYGNSQTPGYTYNDQMNTSQGYTGHQQSQEWLESEKRSAPKSILKSASNTSVRKASRSRRSGTMSSGKRSRSASRSNPREQSSTHQIDSSKKRLLRGTSASE